MSLKISRLPWADKPRHEYGVWYRVISADDQFIGTARGEGNATLLQSAPRLLEALEVAAAQLEEAAQRHNDPALLNLLPALEGEIRRAKGETA